MLACKFDGGKIESGRICSEIKRVVCWWVCSEIEGVRILRDLWWGIDCSMIGNGDEYIEMKL